MVLRAIRHFGAIDVLINIAGTITVSPIQHVTMEDYHYCDGYKLILERGERRLSHRAAYAGAPLRPHRQHQLHRRQDRSASPCSVLRKQVRTHRMVRALRGELAKDGIFVTTVCPGLMRTGSPRNASFKGQHEAEYAWFKTSDSLPGISVSAETAAEQIIEPTRRGDVELIIGALAKFGALFDQILPEWSGELASIAGRFLSGPGGIETDTRSGSDSESKFSETPLSRLSDQAAENNNGGISAKEMV